MILAIAFLGYAGCHDSGIDEEIERTYVLKTPKTNSGWYISGGTLAETLMLRRKIFLISQDPALLRRQLTEIKAYYGNLWMGGGSYELKVIR